MRKYILGKAGLTIFLFALTVISWIPAKHTSGQGALPGIHDLRYDTYITNLYNTAHLANSGLKFPVFEKAVTGYFNLKSFGEVSFAKSILSIADFDQSSTKKRLWIIDLNRKELLLNTWVAHGQRSGSDKAIHFSNEAESLQSSIGFYVTGERYNGQHGSSLRLDGMDEGFNSNARKRSIVLHGADYVSQHSIDVLGRLGRSQGCPAIAPELAKSVINIIEDKTVLFINFSDQHYTSKYLNEDLAAVFSSGLNIVNPS